MFAVRGGRHELGAVAAEPTTASTKCSNSGFGSLLYASPKNVPTEMTVPSPRLDVVSDGLLTDIGDHRGVTGVECLYPAGRSEVVRPPSARTTTRGGPMTRRPEDRMPSRVASARSAG